MIDVCLFPCLLTTPAALLLKEQNSYRLQHVKTNPRNTVSLNSLARMRRHLIGPYLWALAPAWHFSYSFAHLVCLFVYPTSPSNLPCPKWKLWHPLKILDPHFIPGFSSSSPVRTVDTKLVRDLLCPLLYPSLQSFSLLWALVVTIRFILSNTP